MWKRIAIGCLLAAAAIFAVNVGLLQRHVWAILKDDPRNHGIQAWAYFQYGVAPSEIVYDLRAVGDLNTPADVTRVFLQFAAKLKDQNFDRVYLAFRGERRFMITGAYFHKLGSEYGLQNPVYTLRTMPENLYYLDGRPAFGSWTGGILGVLNKQMEDFNSFHRQWYIEPR